MKRYITDAIYYKIQPEKSAEEALLEKKVFDKLSTFIPRKEYLKMEEDLSALLSTLEKDIFYCGFIEGIRFLFGCIK